jgi:hypothetical protein
MQEFRQPTEYELKELAPFCQCCICRRTYWDKFLLWAFGIGKICSCCVGCLKNDESAEHPDFKLYVELARKVRILAEM